jgi:hypothetical protein
MDDDTLWTAAGRGFSHSAAEVADGRGDAACRCDPRWLLDRHDGGEPMRPRTARRTDVAAGVLSLTLFHGNFSE